MIDAAADLADLIEMSKIEMDEYALEELTIFLASNAQEVKQILKIICGFNRHPIDGRCSWPCSMLYLANGGYA